MDYEITFTREQKIKRFVSCYKFDPQQIEVAVADTQVEADGSITSKNNADIEVFEVQVAPFVEKLLGRPCHCSEWVPGSTKNDPEFTFYADTVRDSLFQRFEYITGRIAKEMAAQSAAKV
jgi:hypothetical protein